MAKNRYVKKIYVQYDNAYNTLPPLWDKIGLNENYINEFNNKFNSYDKKQKTDFAVKEYNKLQKFQNDIDILKEKTKEREKIIKDLKNLKKNINKNFIKKNIKIERNQINELKKLIKQLRKVNYEYITIFDNYYNNLLVFSDYNKLIKNFNFNPNYLKTVIEDCNFLNESKINNNKDLKLYFQKDDPFFLGCSDQITIDKAEKSKMIKLNKNIG